MHEMYEEKYKNMIRVYIQKYDQAEDNNLNLTRFE